MFGFEEVTRSRIFRHLVALGFSLENQMGDETPHGPRVQNDVMGVGGQAAIKYFGCE